jgi:hypothetical protein
MNIIFCWIGKHKYTSLGFRWSMGFLCLEEFELFICDECAKEKRLYTGELI